MGKDNVLQTVTASKTSVSLSVTAQQHIKAHLKKRGKGFGIRLSVGKTGCSGLSYVVDFIDKTNESDLAFTVGGIDVFIDKNSYPYLKGIHMDYVKQGLNQKFVFKNPNQTGECGCGESFTVDAQFISEEDV